MHLFVSIAVKDVYSFIELSLMQPDDPHPRNLINGISNIYDMSIF